MNAAANSFLEQFTQLRRMRDAGKFDGVKVILDGPRRGRGDADDSDNGSVLDNNGTDDANDDDDQPVSKRRPGPLEDDENDDEDDE